jgi:hypothetical protein
LTVTALAIPLIRVKRAPLAWRFTVVDLVAWGSGVVIWTLTAVVIAATLTGCSASHNSPTTSLFSAGCSVLGTRRRIA